jgi:hypothetical protein
MTVLQVIKIFLAFYKTRRFVTAPSPISEPAEPNPHADILLLYQQRFQNVLIYSMYVGFEIL